MKVLRWILVIPVFILYSSIGAGLATAILLKLYNSIFPIEGFWGYILSPFSITLLIGSFGLFLGGASLTLQIAPNIKIASIIIMVLLVLFLGIDYYMRWSELHGIRIAIDLGLVAVLIMNFNFNQGDPKYQ